MAVNGVRSSCDKTAMNSSDDPDICEMLGIILRDRGAGIQIAYDVETALEILRNGQIDLLISDICMPGRDGYALVRETRALEGTGSKVPAIALTSYSREHDILQALGQGFDAHCSEPVQPLELVQTVRRLLSMR